MSVYMYIECMGCLIQLRRCAGESPDALSWWEELTRPQLCQICPNQTRGAEKMKAAHRGLPNQKKRVRKKKGRRQSHYYSSNLVSDRGQEHRFEGVRKVVPISGKIMRFWFVELWAGLLFPMSDWFEGSIYQHVKMQAVWCYLWTFINPPLTPALLACGTVQHMCPTVFNLEVSKNIKLSALEESFGTSLWF